MNDNKDFSKFTEFILVGFVWIVLIVAPVFFRKDNTVMPQEILNMSKTLIPLFVIFLINRFLLVPKYLLKKQSLKYVFSVGILIALFSTGLFFMEKPGRHPMPGPQQEHRLPPPPDENLIDARPPPPNFSEQKAQPMPPFLNLLIFSFLLVGFDTGLISSFRLAKSENERSKLEKENTESQLAFLKNQVSPHFFMNTLNNIHSLIDINTEEAKDSIIRLSKLMRHLIYDSESDKISLKKEIEFIENYIDLMRLRFPERVKIDMQIPDTLPDKDIPPLLFTSYIENAFKHGISFSGNSFIFISFAFKADKMIFNIENSKHKNREEAKETGIGIANSRKRLDLIYGKNYTLNINDLDDKFTLELNIPL